MGRRLEQLEEFGIDVVLERRHGVRASILRGILYALSFVYDTIVQLRLYFYRKRVFRERTLGCLVISIGNLTVGGTGKTPIVEKFARALQAGGRRVAILSRRPEEIEKVAAEICGLAIVCDLSKAADIDVAVASAQTQFGPIDILVNNCGGPPAGTFDSITEDQWISSFEQVFLSALRLTRAGYAQRAVALARRGSRSTSSTSASPSSRSKRLHEAHH